jgi:hypothetical protein
MPTELNILNIGPAHFAAGPAATGTPTSELEWRPAGRGDPELALQIAHLADDRAGLGAKIEAANRLAFERLTSADPVLVDLAPARELLHDMSATTILHAGPPIAWEHMCGPMRGAIIGALRYEGLAATAAAAEQIILHGEIRFAPCHTRAAVGPMAGVISASMPLLVVENATGGTHAFANLNEGLGRVLRFGAYDDPVIERLRWMEHTLAPALRRAIQHAGGINLKSIIARALHMGDEVHNRNAAASALLFKVFAPQLAALDLPANDLLRVLEFLAQHEHFFLNCSMAACKSALLAASNIPYSTMVTLMARNGHETGIQVSGLGQRWFTAPAPIPQGLYFPSYSEADANPDLGDSAITETAGLGAFSMGAAPAIVRFVGGTPADALRYTQEMRTIALGDHPAYTLPPLDFRGAPVGIDIRKVVDRNTPPVINTGIAHREPGFGNIGAGVVAAPLACFEAAIRATAPWLVE